MLWMILSVWVMWVVLVGVSFVVVDGLSMVRVVWVFVMGRVWICLWRVGLIGGMGVMLFSSVWM